VGGAYSTGETVGWEHRTNFFIQGMDVINISSIDGKYVKFLLFTPGADKDIKG
jgi:hypothetical protein